jgi:rubrerythrin
MTKGTFDKIANGLKDAIDGNFARVTFVGIDLATGSDWNAVQCPKCFAGIRWRKDAPPRCPFCKVPFNFSNGEQREVK